MQRPSRLLSLAFVLAVAMCLSAFAPQVVASPGEKSILDRSIAGLEIDWTKGQVSARGGAVAGAAMPNPEMARADAQRRAEAQARALLRSGVKAWIEQQEVTLSDDCLDVVEKTARVAERIFESDGGAFVVVAVSFDELFPPVKGEFGGPGIALHAKRLPLRLRPVFACGDTQIRLSSLRFVHGKAPVDRPVLGIVSAKGDAPWGVAEDDCAALRAHPGDAGIVFVRSVSNRPKTGRPR